MTSEQDSIAIRMIRRVTYPRAGPGLTSARDQRASELKSGDTVANDLCACIEAGETSQSPWEGDDQ
jgi:hypothetical protein